MIWEITFHDDHEFHRSNSLFLFNKFNAIRSSSLWLTKATTHRLSNYNYRASVNYLVVEGQVHIDEDSEYLQGPSWCFQQCFLPRLQSEDEDLKRVWTFYGFKFY